MRLRGSPAFCSSLQSSMNQAVPLVDASWQPSMLQLCIVGNRAPWHVAKCNRSCRLVLTDMTTEMPCGLRPTCGTAPGLLPGAWVKVQGCAVQRGLCNGGLVNSNDDARHVKAA